MILLACTFISCGCIKTYANEPSLDYEIKAAMVYKFLGYCSWPNNRFNELHTPYKIWVIGSDPIQNELKVIAAQRKVDGRPIEIFSAKTLDQIGDAHLVFVSHTMEPLLPSLSVHAKKNSFLIVTENDQGLIDGSTINLRLVDKRIGFDISLINAQDAGISLSSRLLAIAVTVQEERK
jgi:hypothetical protein